MTVKTALAPIVHTGQPWRPRICHLQPDSRHHAHPQTPGRRLPAGGQSRIPSLESRIRLGVRAAASFIRLTTNTMRFCPTANGLGFTSGNGVTPLGGAVPATWRSRPCIVPFSMPKFGNVKHGDGQSIRPVFPSTTVPRSTAGSLLRFAWPENRLGEALARDQPPPGVSWQPRRSALKSNRVQLEIW
jgi:hypothetical protein